ncbi:MAG: right-handed parallel beta-helix repeat-containing protein, partial [Actinobacteria bacterium]|nr:right-handed parallel beta-helix repeat-containing protein [Actinomycetota bacterium]
MDIARSSGHIAVPGRARRVAVLSAVLLMVGLLPALIQPAQADVGTTRYVSPATVGAGTSCDIPGYNTIQAAIDAATAGDTIQVCAGTYYGSVNVNKDVTLHAASGAIVAGQMTVSSDGVTLDGLEITNPSAGYGVLINGHSNVAVTNNHIHDIGSALASGSAQAVYLAGGSSAAITNVVISNNTIDNVGNAGLVFSGSGSAKGIFVGDTAGSGTISGLTINGNKISNVQASSAAWENGGRGAYGVLVNFGGTTAAAITDNTITSLAGLWSHGIGLERNTPGSSISNNIISGLSDNKGGTDSHAIFFESNSSMTSVPVDGQLLGSLDTTAADDSWAGYTHNPVVSLDGVKYLYGVDAFDTAQKAINAAASGGAVDLGPGTYAESVVVNEALTLNGPNVGVAGNGERKLEATVSQVNITANDVVVDGFSFANAGVQMNITGATTLSGVRVQNNIFSGYGSVGFPTHNAGNLTVTRNLFKAPLAATEAMQIKADDSTPGGCNGTVVSDNVFTAASNNGAADVNFSCTGSGSTGVTVSG